MFPVHETHEYVPEYLMELADVYSLSRNPSIQNGELEYDTAFKEKLRRREIFRILERSLRFFFAPIAQLDRAAAYGAVGWGFDSLWVHKE